jgi:hypothetical protein
MTASPPTPTPPPTARSAPPGAPPPQPQPRPSRDWSAGRVTALVLGVIVLMGSLFLALAGTTLAFADNGLRDDDGFLMSGDETFSTATYAITSETIDIDAAGDAENVPRALLGDARLTAVPNDDAPVFIGLGRTADVEEYLSGVGHARVIGFTSDDPDYRTFSGGSPSEAPADSAIWVEQSSGTGAQSLTWDIEDGEWTVVVMNADGTPDVSADVSAGATVPVLGWLVAVTLILAFIGLVVAFVLMLVALSSRSRPTPP